MPLVSLIAAAALSQGRATQASFTSISRQISATYNSKNFAGLAKFYAPDCSFVYPGDRIWTGKEQIAAMAAYYPKFRRFSVSLEIRLVSSTAKTAHTIDTETYSTTDVHGGSAITFNGRQKADCTWVHGLSGWKLARSNVFSREEKGSDGKWGSSESYAPDVSAWNDGGPGQAPIAVLKKVLARMIRAYIDLDLDGAIRPLSPQFYAVDVDGTFRSRAKVVEALRMDFGGNNSIDYRANYVIESWSKDSARVLSSSVVGILRSENGRTVLDTTRQEAESWWVLSRSGWQIDHVEVNSVSRKDAQGHWQTQRAQPRSKL